MVSRSLVGRSVLHLGEVTAREAGQLTCQADNGVGGPVSDTISLPVLAPPTVTITSSLTSCSLTVTCSTTSATPGWLRIMISGRVLLAEDILHSVGVSSYSVELDICREGEAREVTCQAENRQGSRRDRLLLTRESERPPPPVLPLPLLSSSSNLRLPALLLLCALFLKL